MRKIVPFILLTLFSVRLFASVAPHLQQLEHDWFIILRSALIFGSLCLAMSFAIKKYKKRVDTSKNNQ